MRNFFLILPFHRPEFMEQEHQSTMEETEEAMLRPGDLGTTGGSDTRWNDPGGYSTRKIQPG